MQKSLYQGFSAAAVAGSSTSSSTRARMSSIFWKSDSSSAAAIASALISPDFRSMVTMRPMMSVHPSITRSSAAYPPPVRAVKLAMRSACQPGCSDAAHSGSVGRLPRTSIDDGVRWNTYSCSHASARYGTACTAVAPVPMIPTRLSRRPSSPPRVSPPV